MTCLILSDLITFTHVCEWKLETETEITSDNGEINVFFISGCDNYAFKEVILCPQMMIN